MPIYEDDRLSKEDLLDLRKTNRCKQCGGPLNVFLDPVEHKAFIACWDYLRTYHDEGIEREASRYEKEGIAALNIPSRRKILEEEYGTEMTKQLEKYQGGGALTKDGAIEILKLVYPGVPEPEIIRTALLCRDFGLHPLMKEVYIIGFENHKTGKIEYSTVLGINANRKLAADKKGAYSFLDDTPRAAYQEEIVKQYGRGSEEEKDNLISICKLKGEKGNEAIGFGLWPKNEEPKATKNNTKRNMANIRSERQAMDRLPGAAIPLRHLDVIDESVGEALKDDNIIEVEGRLVNKTTGVIQEPEPAKSTPVEADVHWCDEHNCAFEVVIGKYGPFYSHKIKGGYCKEKKKTAEPKPEYEEPPDETCATDKELREMEVAAAAKAETTEEAKGFIDIEWFKESLKILQPHLKSFSDSNLLSYMKLTYKVEADTVLEAVVKLDKGQAAHFVQKIQDAVDMI